MLKITTIFLNPAHQKQLAALGKSRGLRASAMTRIAVEEYLRRAAKEARAAK